VRGVWGAVAHTSVGGRYKEEKEDKTARALFEEKIVDSTSSAKSSPGPAQGVSMSLKSRKRKKKSKTAPNFSDEMPRRARESFYYSLAGEGKENGSERRGAIFQRGGGWRRLTGKKTCDRSICVQGRGEP